METAVTVAEVYQLVSSVYDIVADKADEQVMIDFVTSLSDGEKGNNDLELILTDIRDSLQYNEDYTALQELSSRMELIDTRLDLEFECLNFGIGVIDSVLLAYASMKFLSWIFRFVTC